MTQLTQDLLVNNLLAEINRLTRRVEKLEREVYNTPDDVVQPVRVPDIESDVIYVLYVRVHPQQGQPQLIMKRITPRTEAEE